MAKNGKNGRFFGKSASACHVWTSPVLRSWLRPCSYQGPRWAPPPEGHRYPVAPIRTKLAINAVQGSTMKIATPKNVIAHIIMGRYCSSCAPQTDVKQH